jgi:hypothetical protein
LRLFLRMRLRRVAADSDRLQGRGGRQPAAQDHGQITRPKIVLTARALFFIISFSISIIFIGGIIRTRQQDVIGARAEMLMPQ